MITICVITTIVGLVIIRKYVEFKWGKCRNKENLDGKVAIVTGANSGIGLEVAKELASRNAQVIIACRTLEKAQNTCSFIKSKLTKEPKLVPIQLNLESLKSIQQFAQDIQQNFPKIHLLVNNAGVAFPKNVYLQTEDSFEIHFGVNYLGHFYLTKLLLNLLLKDSFSRVIIVSSLLHEKGEIDVEDLNNSLRNKKSNMYANSKLACVYFGRELAKRHKELNVYICCPGWVYTGLFRHSKKWYYYILFFPIAFLFMRTPWQGAQTPIYCATDPTIKTKSGLLYRNCKSFDSRTIFYDNIQTQLWEKSESLIKEALE